MMMADGGQIAHTDDDAARAEAKFDVVHSDSIRFFPELVTELGGDPDNLLHKAHIDRVVLTKRGSILEYRAMIRLFELAATELPCPDFGMKLAALQGGTRVMGPIGVAMKNSKTLGQALGYCARQIQAYSPATRVRFVPDRAKHELFVSLEILLDGLSDKSQVIEHAMLLANLNVIDITGATARARRVSFRHDALSPQRVYQAAFGCEVVFGAAADGILFQERDLLCPVVDPDEQLYELATSFIASHYPPGTPPMHARVRALINRYLGTEACTSERIATELCMHPRTLQRRLKCEGKSFESIKDEVRREVAMRYLHCSDMPLTKLAAKLGYAEQSVLSRSCYRWFAASPRELREKSAAEQQNEG
jgi:AraC-like DNA-binding protein